MASAHETSSAGKAVAAAELTHRGFVVALTQGRGTGIDLSAYWPGTQRSVTCRVRTTNGKNRPAGQWMLSKPDEQPAADLYILVYLPADKRPARFSIVPAAEVAAQIRASHKKWETTPGKSAQQRSTDNDIRFFVDKLGHWRNRWDLLLEAVGASKNTPPGA